MVSLFRTSQLTYKFDYGYIRESTPNLEGANIAGGEFRYLGRWFDLLDALGFTGVKETHRNDEGMPETFQLYQNSPNPFNPTTTIRFTLPSREWVTLKIFDLLGKEKRVLMNDECRAGEHAVVFDARHLPSGVYFYILETDTFSQVRKMVLLR